MAMLPIKDLGSVGVITDDRHILQYQHNTAFIGETCH